tara:strand:+ start:193 stop:618 length:426 start_codon:yes stop_codon:yes gene_type:complete
MKSLDLPDFRECNDTIPTGWWLRISTRLNPFAVNCTLRPFGSVQISVIALLGVLGDSIAAFWCCPLAFRGTRIAVFAVGTAVITVLSWLDNAIATGVVTDNRSAVPRACVSRSTVVLPSVVTGLAMIDVPVAAVATELAVF